MEKVIVEHFNTLFSYRNFSIVLPTPIPFIENDHIELFDTIVFSDEDFVSVIIKNKKKEGFCISFYSLRQKESEVYYFNNLKNGEEIVWGEDGTLIAKRGLKNDEKDGEEIVWNEDGTLMMKRGWKNDKLDGEKINYYGDGRIEDREFYKEGERVGRWEHYTYY